MPSEPPVSSAPVCRDYRTGYGMYYRLLHGEGASRWAIRLDNRANWDPFGCRRQSFGHSNGKLAGDFAGEAAAVAAPDFSTGIPPESTTLVVVPTMLTSPQNIVGLIEALEVRFW